METKSFKDLIVWQKSRDLAVAVYKLTEELSRSELEGLTNQMIAFGSGSELESQIEIAKALFPNLNYQQVEKLLSEIMKILNNFLK